MNRRKHSRTTLSEIQQCLSRGMSLKQTAETLNCSMQGLRQACSLLEELNHETRSDGLSWRAMPNDPFGLASRH